jgi:hypothetical protein
MDIQATSNVVADEPNRFLNVWGQKGLPFLFVAKKNWLRDPTVQSQNQARTNCF